MFATCTVLLKIYSDMFNEAAAARPRSRLHEPLQVIRQAGS